MAYIINNWDKNFEVAQSRKVKSGEPLKWVAMPTSHDNIKVKRLMMHDNGAALFGAWCAFVQLAAKQKNRGTVDMDADDMAILTNIPSSVFTLMIDVCMSPKINWIRCDSEQSGSVVGAEWEHSPSTIQDNTRHISCTKQSLARVSYSDSFEAWWKTYKRSGSSKSKAYEQWKRKGLEGQHEMMIAKTSAYRASVEQPEYMKHAERFISYELYNEDFSPYRKKSDKPGTGMTAKRNADGVLVYY